jgi:NAD(P)-dependent dehydrogenase (short-subunit alcohol dehydrogenase family)
MLPSDSELAATGDNYTLHVVSGVVVLRVWSRRDISYARGAALAQEKVQVLGQLAGREDVRALYFDLVDAAPVVGPITEAAVRAMFRTFVDRGHAIAVLVGNSATQELQFTRLLRDVGTRARPARGLVTLSRDDADAYVRSFVPAFVSSSAAAHVPS